jgi:hypothetical protein
MAWGGVMLTGRDYGDEKVSGVLMALNSRSFDETIDCNRISIFIDPTEIEREKKSSNILTIFFFSSMLSAWTRELLIPILLPPRLERPQLPLLTTHQVRPHAIHSTHYFWSLRSVTRPLPPPGRIRSSWVHSVEHSEYFKTMMKRF